MYTCNGTACHAPMCCKIVNADQKKKDKGHPMRTAWATDSLLSDVGMQQSLQTRSCLLASADDCNLLLPKFHFSGSSFMRRAMETALVSLPRSHVDGGVLYAVPFCNEEGAVNGDNRAEGVETLIRTNFGRADTLFVDSSAAAAGVDFSRHLEEKEEEHAQLLRLSLEWYPPLESLANGILQLPPGSALTYSPPWLRRDYNPLLEVEARKMLEPDPHLWLTGNHATSIHSIVKNLVASGVVDDGPINLYFATHSGFMTSLLREFFTDVEKPNNAAIFRLEFRFITTASGGVLCTKARRTGAMTEALVYSGHLGSTTETALNRNKVPDGNDAARCGFFEYTPLSDGVDPTMVMECMFFLEAAGVKVSKPFNADFV
mmetsp:Transcript_8716/g.11075  ORF Transcript_8716/g.11075 Transcript_8716/m.11075 type:complete len:374 (+) Transcript_8716:259-1380(+)